MTRKLVAVCIAAMRLEAAPIAADSARGARLFETLSCIQCHSINGMDCAVTPDLCRSIDRNFTPATLAATMWNDAPIMCGAMRERNIPDERSR